nr:MAG TPA: tail protein [Caudoviricetes sp.]
MAIKATAEQDVLDITDGYSINLSNDNYTFQGTTTSVEGTQSLTCKITAMRGSDKMVCSVGDITAPTGLSIVSDGKTPEPTLTITATSALTKSGSVIIPVKTEDVTIEKVFSWSIAFKGNNGTSVIISNTSITYQVGTSGTTAPTGSWSNAIPSVPSGQYLWTKTVVTYSDGKSTTAYSVSRNPENGADGTSVTVKTTVPEYQASNSGTTVPTGAWSTTPVAGNPGQYVWTRITVTYSDNKTAVSYSISRNGANGADSITMAIKSSNGVIFKNTAIATTLTARVFKGGIEVTGSALTALGTIKWYKDGGSTAVATGSSLTINAGDVDNKATYTAQLEG